MGGELKDFVKKRIEEHMPLDSIKEELLGKGYLENDVDSAIEGFSSSFKDYKKDEAKRNNILFSFKEIFDRIGFGFSNHQFINILFHASGASLFFIGIINALRALLSTWIGMFLRECSKLRAIPKTFISTMGIIFGFSFFLMAISVLIKQPVLFALSLILGVVGIAAHGDTYGSFFSAMLKKERRFLFLRKISVYGLFITGISLIFSALLIDYYGMGGSLVSLSLFGRIIQFRVYGFLFCFEITAMTFIFSSFVISIMHDQREKIKCSVKEFLPDFRAKVHAGLFFLKTEKKLWLLIFSTVLTTLLQVLGNSYYGIFIYERFKDAEFGGFTNVAFIFLIALIFAFIGPFLARKISRYVGISPMIVFGTMLIAMMPIALAFNPNFYVIAVANAIAIIGSAIVGVSQGLLSQRLLSSEQTESYFKGVDIMATVVFILLAPLGAFFANAFGFTAFFKLIAQILFFVITPINFIVVVMLTRKRN